MGSLLMIPKGIHAQEATKLFRRFAAPAFVLLATTLAALTGSTEVIPLAAVNFPPRQ